MTIVRRLRLVGLAGMIAGLLATSAARADSLDERFDRAVVALASHRPEAAARELRSVVALGVEDPDVYTNLGIAEAESMHYGAAMVAFERALSLRPRDEIATRGLENATTLLARRISERTGTPAEVAEPGALESFARSVPEAVSSSGLLVAVWIACIAAAIARFAARETVRIAGMTIAIAGALAAAGFGLAVLGRARIGETIAPAIVVRDQVRVVTSPDERAPTVATLEEGRRVTLVERHGAYARVVVDGRSRGWVARDAIGTY